MLKILSRFLELRNMATSYELLHPTFEQIARFANCYIRELRHPWVLRSLHTIRSAAILESDLTSKIRQPATPT
jgi:hypothetical protein